MSSRLTALLLASVLTGLWPATAWAQAAIMSGVVRSTDGEPIAGATVTAETAPSNMADQTARTQTNGSGRFSLIGLRPGRWLFAVEKAGFNPVLSPANVRRTGRTNMSFVLDFDAFNPPAPATGALAGIRGIEIQEGLLAAHGLFDEGDFDAAIGAYEEMLERVPRLTGLHLQIGHAYREMGDYGRALAAYQTVPANSPSIQDAEVAITSLQTESGVSGP